MTRGSVVWFVAAAIVLVGPNVAAVVVPFEHWPWTCGPMFAASPVDNARYRVSFLLEKSDGTTSTLRARKAAGLSEWHFRRSFLVKAWGAEDPHSPHGYVAGDTAGLRANRVRRYVDGMVRFSKRKGRRIFDDAVALRIELEQVHPRKQRTLLGRYTLHDHRFVAGGDVP